MRIFEECFHTAPVCEVLWVGVVFLSPELTKRYPEINWDDIVETRNTITHGYEGLDLNIIWSSINKKILKLKKNCEKILKELKRSYEAARLTQNVSAGVQRFLDSPEQTDCLHSAADKHL